MLMISGTFLGLTTRKREYEGRSWDEDTAHILDGVHTTYVTLAKDFDSKLLPEPNQPVVLEVYGRGHTNKRVYLTCVRVVDPASLVGLPARPAAVRSA